MGKAQDRFQQIQDRIAQTLRELPPIIGEEAVNFTLDNFERQGWLGNSVEPWQKRKNPTKWGKRDETDRAILVKTAKLKRSIRISKIHEHKVTIQAGGADIPYARVHNEGFKGDVTQKVGEYIRKDYIATDIHPTRIYRGRDYPHEWHALPSSVIFFIHYLKY